MRLPVLVPAALLALMSAAACDDPRPAEAPEPAPTPQAATLGGVDLGQPIRALGTEPFWGVDIRPDAIVYSGVDRPEQRGSNPGPTVQGTTAVWATATDTGAALVVTLVETPCSDGMSDRTYPLTARVEIGDESLNGCAASEAFVLTSGERGG